MKIHVPFALSRFWAIVVKEFIQMRRDRITFGMMIGIPLIQLVLFGFGINADPKHLPTPVLLADYGASCELSSKRFAIATTSSLFER